MLTALASHNPDIQRLIEKGYALRYDAGHLVVRDIPYLDADGALQTAAFATKLVPIDAHRYMQDDHQVFFTGGVPHGLNGAPVPNLAGGPVAIHLDNADTVVQRSFSNKPPNGFPDFFAKIEHYVAVVGGPAIARYGVSPLTRRVDFASVASVFTYPDSMSVRAEIGDLAQRFKDEVVAIIGLGGTGASVLDHMVKTHVREIRGFDGDIYHVHTAYRSPGRLDPADLGRTKAAVYESRYGPFRKGLVLKSCYINDTSAAELDGVTFAFVCVDKGSARAAIFALLIRLGIPFIDVGMGLRRQGGALAGALRVTTFGAGDPGNIHGMGLAETADAPDDAYRQNIQIGELNALNAALAVIRYKQLKGFYANSDGRYQTVFDIAATKTLHLP